MLMINCEIFIWSYCKHMNIDFKMIFYVYGKDEGKECSRVIEKYKEERELCIHNRKPRGRPNPENSSLSKISVT